MSPIKEALIKGSFTPAEAKEVLSKLFISKIHMHGVSTFSSLIREGAECADHNARMQELKSSLDRLNTYLADLPADHRLVIHCDVFIEPQP